jgi:hypothetical protein
MAGSSPAMTNHQKWPVLRRALLIMDAPSPHCHNSIQRDVVEA